jgi:Spy/CpxP family protein refolding chaperone
MRIIHSLSVLALALALPALAQTPPAALAAPQEGRSFGRMYERIGEKLNLTDAQKAACKDIIGKHRPAMIAKHKAAKEARKAFFEAVMKPETAPDTLKTLNRAAADARLEAMLEGRAMRQELRAVLTPEQREKAAFILGRMAGMHGDHGRWGGMGMMGGPERPGMGGCPCAPGPMAKP